MRRTQVARPISVSSVMVAMLLGSCAGQPTEPSASVAGVPSGRADTVGPELPCGDTSYPCTRSDTDPAVLRAQATSAAGVIQRLNAGSRDDAFQWIQDQEGVVESHLSDTLIMFRLDGALPTSIITPVGSAGAAASDHTEPPIAQLASAHRPAVEERDNAASVVGVGTDREHPQNLKQALFLEPWASSEGTIFNETTSGINPPELLGMIKPDYSHADAITHYTDGEVTPDTFSPDTWRQYDFIYVSTHGASWPDGAVLETGVRQPWDGQDATFQPICDSIIDEYAAYRGVECGVQHADGRSYVTVDVTHIFFLAYFLGEGRQLDRAIVVIEACESLKYNHLPLAIVGTSSAYVGWTDFINLDDAREAAGRLLVHLGGQGRRGKTVGAAMEALCNDVQCGGETFRDPEGSGEAPWLKVYQGSPGAQELRLYELHTARDPNDPTTILEDGAELRIKGTPGDGRDDQLEVTAEVVGVIDPDDASDGGSLGDYVFASSHTSPAAFYDLHFYIGDDLIGSGNLGNPREGAEVIALDETTYRYTDTFPLPFDVDPEGTDATLRVVVDLPEGGISDYEIGVTLTGGSYAIIQVGNTTFEFDGTGSWQCFIGEVLDSDDVSIVAGSGNADGDSFSAQLDPRGGGLVVHDEGTGEKWEALPEGHNATVLHLLPVGSSQVDTITIENGRAWGQATFIEVNAAVAAWGANRDAPAWPPSIPGTFEILCGG